MPIDSLDNIWMLVSEECKKLISETAFNCFLKDLVPSSFKDGEFVLACGNEYSRSIIEDNYTEILETALKAAMGIDIKVRIICEEEEEKIKSAEQFSEGLTFEDFFTFDNFIVGSTNRFAHAASKAVADNLGIVYNPLIIYGPSGRLI